MSSTENIRKWLPGLVDRYDIKTVCDAGAGDLHWVSHVEWDVDFYPFDLVPRHKDVKQLDISQEALPPCDLIICRMVFNHMSPEDTRKAIELFKKSGKYLLASTYSVKTRPFHDVDLGLGSPIEGCDDGHEEGCELCLWSL